MPGKPIWTQSLDRRGIVTSAAEPKQLKTQRPSKSTTKFPTSRNCRFLSSIESALKDPRQVTTPDESRHRGTDGKAIPELENP
jgi:hypothetical protein